MKITRVETYPVEIPIKPERRMISSLGEHTVLALPAGPRAH